MPRYVRKAQGRRVHKAPARRRRTVATVDRRTPSGRELRY
jgi:hypothetical protein